MSEQIPNKISLKKSKKNFKLFFHQEYAVRKNLEIISRAEPFAEGVMGQLPRMGKSHIMLGTILEYSKNLENCNCMIVSTAPNDSLPPLLEDLRKYKEFEEYFFMKIDEDLDENFASKLKKKNIFLASKQFLQYRINDQSQIQLPIIDLLFTDEIHNGGCTDLSQDIFKIYGFNAHKFYVSGTYGIAIDFYQIQKDNLNLFDLQSIALCKNITSDSNQFELIEKHGPIMQELIQEYKNNDKLCEVEVFFNRLPSLVIHSVNIKKDVLTNFESIKMNESEFALSLKLLFELNPDKNGFVNHNGLVQLCRGVFNTEQNTTNQPQSILQNIQQYNLKDGLRGFDKDYPIIIICFLPFGKGQRIMDVSKSFKKLFEDEAINPDFDILALNDNVEENALEKINKKYNQIIGSKKGLVVLSGKKCVMGVSIPRCDVVLLFNQWQEMNPIFQAMYRCMTDDYDEPIRLGRHQYTKKYGHIVDINFHRQIQLMISYSQNTFNNLFCKDALQKALKYKLFQIDQKSWYNTIFEDEELNTDDVSNRIYESWFQNADSQRLKQIIEDRFLENIIIDNDTLSLLNGIHVPILKKNGDNVLLLHNDHSLINNPSNTNNNNQNTNSNSSDENHTEKENLERFREMLNHVIFLSILLTIYQPDLNNIFSMLKFIQQNNVLKELFIKKMKDWYQFTSDDLINLQKKNIFIESFMNLLENYFPLIHPLHNNIQLMKELFSSNLPYPKTLHRMIHQYVSSVELEVKAYGNVSTPNEIVNEILDKIPTEFWSQPRKVFDPVCGKGTFLLKIIHKFMNSLTFIQNENERYQFIVENCIYYSDIDLFNIYITNVLLKKNFQNIKLNFYCGNSLDFNPIIHWNLSNQFDSIIMNPPFNDGSGNKGSNHKLWEHFVNKSILDWLSPNGYLGTLHPSGWRNVNGICGDILKEKQMLFLKIFNDKHGKKLFNCNIRFDLYLLQNCPNQIPTNIIDESGVLNTLFLKDQIFIPNKNFNYIYSLVANDNEQKLNIIYDRTMYGSDKKNMSNKESDTFKYPCVYSIKVNDEPKFYYSNELKGHFGIPKLIFASGATGFLKDIHGQFGLTNFARGIVESPQNIEELYLFMKSNKFNTIKESLYITMSEINFNVLKLFKHNFWKNN